MDLMLKRIVAVAAVVLTVSFGSPVYALPSAHSSLRGALVEYLYQYGKEMFYRGVDPQEASYVFQRALVLDCHHQGAQNFLNKLHQKYPDVSVRVWGCADGSAEEETTENTLRSERTSITDKLPDEESKARALKREVMKAEHQMNVGEIKEAPKPAAPAVPPESLEKTQESDNRDLSYSNIASDQKDLIRIQQSNIDYLKSELAEAKKQMNAASPEAFTKTQVELADAGLDVQEHKMATEAKDVEAHDLKQQLNDLQEQLALVQKIVDEKNRTIESLQKEAKPTNLAGQ
jgi:hypothetical protein